MPTDGAAGGDGAGLHRAASQCVQPERAGGAGSAGKRSAEQPGTLLHSSTHPAALPAGARLLLGMITVFVPQLSAAGEENKQIEMLLLTLQVSVVQLPCTCFRLLHAEHQSLTAPPGCCRSSRADSWSRPPTR